MDTAQRIVDDLLNLEVDIILKTSMTGRKMPDPAHALLDVIGFYDSYLCTAANQLNAVWGEPRVPVRVRPTDEEVRTKAGPMSPNRHTEDGVLMRPLETRPVDNVISENTFDALRERAVEAEAVYRSLLGGRIEEDERGVILTRIYRNCDQIKAILRRPEVRNATEKGIDRDSSEPGVLPLTADDVVVLRKVWEIGTETIVMQTVVQLDGDIITRVQRGRDAAAYKALHDLHQEAVGSALRHWQFLVQTVSQFLTGAVRSIFLH